MGDFEIFGLHERPPSTASTTRSPHEPTLTITRRGEINLSPGTVSVLPESVGAVRLLWDRERRLLALEATELGDPLGRPLNAMRSSSGRRLSAADFCTWAGVPLDAARRWPVHGDDNGRAVADLAAPGLVVTSGRDRTRM